MPITIRDLLKCGGCGGVDHRLFNTRRADEDRHHIQNLEVECVICGSMSQLTVSRIVQFENTKGNGTLCGGWG